MSEVQFFMSREGVSPCQQRLFAVACARQIWDAFTDERCRKAIEVSEAFADGQVSEKELEAANKLVTALVEEWELAGSTEHLRQCGHRGNPWAVPPALKMAVDCTSLYAVAHGASYELRSHFYYMKRKELGIEQYKDLYHEQMEEPQRKGKEIIKSLLSHYKNLAVKKMRFSAKITQLADALYHGENCSFALHDALLEEGLPRLADHFSETHHPKGCRRLDMILGKE